MKKLFIVPVLFFTIQAAAQGSIQLSNNNNQATISANAIIPLNTSASSNLKFNIDVKNISNATKKYLVKRYDITLNSGALAYYCFAGNCYGPPTIQSPDTLLLNAGQSASQNTLNPYFILTADLDEGPLVGYSLIKYTFFDPFNISDSVQVSLKYNSPVGISELKSNLKSAELFPNPSQGYSTLIITAQSAFYGKVMVFNALGELLSEQNENFGQGENRVALDLEHAVPGVYLVSVRCGNSSVTKRLVIK